MTLTLIVRRNAYKTRTATTPARGRPRADPGGTPRWVPHQSHNPINDANCSDSAAVDTVDNGELDNFGDGFWV
jgi:hypothetical protein